MSTHSKARSVRHAAITCSIALALPVCALVVTCFAQSFDIVSIKPSGNEPLAPGYGRGMGFQPGGRYVTLRTPVLTLIAQAFHEDGQPGLRLDQIDRTSLPAWTTNARYDIEARLKNAGSATPEATRAALLKSLLVDRFKLQVHFETRDQEIYALTLAKRDGSLGSGLREDAQYDCDAIEAAFSRGDGSSVPAVSGGGQPCAMTVSRGTARGRAVPLRMLASMLGPNVGGRRVVDGTGLTGRYDVDLHWTPDSAPSAVPPSVLSPADLAAAEWPSVFTALVDQLGLKLESAHESVNVLVVDRIEQPTPN